MENGKLISALIEAQKEIKPPVKDKKGQFNNWYASLDAVYDSCRDVLASHGLTLSHDVERVGSEFDLLTILYHISGEKISMRCPIRVEKTGPQGFASALTYARRYAVCSLLALPSDEDDDGAQAQKETTRSKKDSRDERITEEQKAYLQKILSHYEDAEARLSKALKDQGVKGPQELLRKNFSNFISAVRS